MSKEDYDTYLLEKIKLLEEESERIKQSVKQDKWKNFKNLATGCFLFFLLWGNIFGILGFGVGMGIYGKSQIKEDKCVQWCEANRTNYSTPQAYEACFKGCDVWVDG